MKLLKFFKNFMGVYIGVVLVCILIFTKYVGYQFRRNYACDYIWIILADALLIILLWFLISFLKRDHIKLWEYFHTEKCFYSVLIVGGIATFIIQLFIVYGGWFIAGWDTRNVIFPDMQMNADYMSMYTNQLFLAGLFRSIYFLLTESFSYSFDDYYFALVILSMVCVFASIIFSAFIAKKIANPFIAIITFLCAVLFIGFSPWIMIPYSDTFSMLFTTLTLFWYFYIKNKPAKWFLIFFSAIIGFWIKPTAIFVLCAIIFVEICLSIGNIKSIILNFNKKFAIKVCISLVCALIGFGFANYIGNRVCDYGVQIDENRNFTATHFLMMGVNYENHGSWNNDDVNISRSFETVDERQAGNIREWMNRIKTYGLDEIAFIMLNKTLTNFNDGSFAWEAETPWMMENRGDNPIIWALYGIDPANDHNDLNNFSAYPRQALWYLILIGCIFSIFNKKPKRGEFVIYLTILAISAFLTICEPDPRYLLLYIPYFVLLAPKGWSFVYHKYVDYKYHDLQSNNIPEDNKNDLFEFREPISW